VCCVHEFSIVTKSSSPWQYKRAMTFVIPPELRPSDPRFGVGPSLIPQERLKELLGPQGRFLGTSHRQTPVKNIVATIQSDLLDYYGAPAGHKVVIGNGGATYFWDVLGLNFVLSRAHHFVCGEFSEKCFLALERMPWIKNIKLGSAPGDWREFSLYAELFQSFTSEDTVFFAQNETSTGVMVRELPPLSPALVCVDATSSAGVVKTDLRGIDVFYFSPQKAFASEGGLWIAIVSPRALERSEKVLKERAQKSERFCPASLDFSQHFFMSLKSETLTTPSLVSLFFLHQQLKILKQKGLSQVHQEAEEKARLMYQWAESHPELTPFVARPEQRSLTVATINCHQDYKVSVIADFFRKEGFAIDIEGYRKLAKNQFRIGLFPQILSEDLDKLRKLIDLAISHYTKLS
jgi:phosphoserine aminotransferase